MAPLLLMIVRIDLSTIDLDRAPEVYRKNSSEREEAAGDCGADYATRLMG